MGSALSSDSLTVDQFKMFLDDLKSREASVIVTVSAFHYEMYEEEYTDWDREDWERRNEDMWEESGGRRHHRHHGARPPSPRRSIVKQRKVQCC